VKVDEGLLEALNVPVPPLTTLQVPVPGLAALPPKLVVVPSAQMFCVPPTVAAGAAGVIVMLTSACVEAHGAFVIVQRSTTGPAPVRCVKVDEGLLEALNVPVPPLTTLQVPVPGLAALPPKLAVVPSAQMFCVPPTVAAGAAGVIVMLTSACVEAHGAFVIVQRTTTGPAPVACVKVAFAVMLFGLKEPVPPLTTLQAPVPTDGTFPPRPRVVPNAQIVCGPPTVAVVGFWLIVRVTSAVDAVHGALLIVQRNAVTVPEVWVKVAPGVVAFGLKVPAPPPMMLHAPAPTLGVLPPSAAVVPSVQIVCAPPTVAVVGNWLTVTVTLAQVVVLHWPLYRAKYVVVDAGLGL